MKNNSNKKEILITGTSVLRGVEILVACILIYSLVQTIVFGKEIDTMILLMMTCSLLLLEVTLSREKDKKNEQDSKKWYESSAIVSRALLDKYFGV